MPAAVSPVDIENFGNGNDSRNRRQQTRSPALCCKQIGSPAVTALSDCYFDLPFLRLGHIDDPGLSIFLQASMAQFGSDAGLLVAPEGNVGLQVEMPVDPNRSR
jgi:hypothetical protein